MLLWPVTSMNGAICGNLLESKLELHIREHNCQIFMNDVAPCRQCKVMKNYLGAKSIQMFEWPGNSPDLYLIETL